MYASDLIIFLLSNNFQPFLHDGSAGNKFLQLLLEEVFFSRSLLKGNFAAYRILSIFFYQRKYFNPFLYLHGF